MAGTEDGFLQYHEPDTISTLVLISFFFFLSSVGWVFNKAIRAGLIGQILIGILFGAPVGDILGTDWQESFMALGYIGLILIIFEGGLTIRLDLLKANFLLSTVAAAIGITVPIALCYLLLYLGFGYGALETFIIGAALSTTSIGTTFVVIKSSPHVDLTHTKVGTVLISAALFDDVVGLIMVSVISNLGGIGAGGGGNIGWIVGRPILASFAIGTVSPLLAKLAAGPLYRRFVERRIAAWGHRATICLMIIVLAGHLAVCGYAGASFLFGAFLAGTFLSTLSHGPIQAVEGGSDGSEVAPAFHETFETFISGSLAFVLEPLFFASIGFAIPFTRLWTGPVVWRGILLSLLMAIGKAVVGFSVPLWDLVSRQGSQIKPQEGNPSEWAPAALLGMAMIARGEIGLLIIQLGLNDTSFLSEEAFLVAIWAIVLNTIVGPLSVGLLLNRLEQVIANNPRWGLQKQEAEDGSSSGLPRNSMQQVAKNKGRH
ncbi:sodium-hydrogen antiporter [Diaporthe helianthi]|uniref:Sodium-hydrogen antiporter n=1 Tax=Diaporthe helianthi TaxID=158607 RepID=A0A2P5I9I5_DIAHE|nr:sodium-hydrogen antiporter [Diaporthe helianthi]